MKNILFYLLLLVAMPCYSQNFKAPEKENVVLTDTTTTYTYEIQGIRYPVCKGKSGAFYIWKTSKKTGKKYKYYLPKEIQIRMGRIYK